MAVSSSSHCLLLLLFSSLNWLTNCASAFLMDHDRMASSAPYEPHFTECISRDQETFRCWWSPGSLHNLSSPGALRVFYLRKDLPTSEWKECPKYIHSNRECFFDVNHTSIWIPYCMQLRSQNITYFSQDDCFTVENIVRPDPPVSLNWTLLNISPSGLSYDVMVNWEPPSSADVKAGWMRLEYEIQYRERNSTNWETLEIQPHTHQTIFGLTIGKEYEVHIRCRMVAFTKFGEFSDSVYIQVTEVPSKESTFPLTPALVVGAVGILVLILLIAVSQQHRLMMILLPPVPVPKIKGIDPELLKKGKLDEFNFILSGGGMEGLPAYAPDFYQDVPWIEFIEVDDGDEEAGEKENNHGSDTQRLLTLPQSISHNIGCSNAISFCNNDSGHTNCYEPEMSGQDTQMLTSTLLPGQAEDDTVGDEDVGRAGALDCNKRPVVQAQPGEAKTWVNMDFYAQVSNVMPSGGVVLSPGQQLRIQESTAATDEETQNKAKDPKDSEAAEEERQDEQQFQLVVMDPEGSGYTTESSAQQINTPLCSLLPDERYKIVNPEPAETKPAAAAESNQSPYILPDSPQTQVFSPVADYTVVQELDNQHSLLLNPPPHQSPPSFLPQHNVKALPAMPAGYITPDLLGNFSQ